MDDDFNFKYVSSGQLGKVIQKVKQTRKDQEDDLKWQRLIGSIQRSNPIPKEADISSSSSSASSEESDEDLDTSSSDGRVSDDNSSASDQVCAPVQLPMRQKSHRNAEGAKKIPNQKLNHATQKLQKITQNPDLIVQKPKFDHQQTVLSLKKSQEAVKIDLARVLYQLQSKDGLKGELSSPRTEGKRKIRLAEFNARIRRNYLYTIKTDIDHLDSILLNKSTNLSKSTTKQAALRHMSKAFGIAHQALLVYRNQTGVRRDCLATLQILESIIELLEKLDESCNMLDVRNEGLISQRVLLSEVLRLAYVEAETSEVDFNERPSKPKPKVTKKNLRKPEFWTKPKPKKKILPKQQVLRPPVLEERPASASKDVSTDMEAFVPVAELLARIKSMQQKPTNVKFVVMKHDGADGVCEVETQTLPAAMEGGEKETQTVEQEAQSNQNCQISEIIKQALEQDMSNDYLTEIINQVINQEFIQS